MKNKSNGKKLKSREKSLPTNGTNGEQSKLSTELSTPKFTLEELNKALLEGFDLMQRVLLDTTYIVAGEAAKCLKEKRGLDCNGLDFIIEKRHVTPFVVSTLKDWTKSDITDKGFEYKVGNVPLRFKFVERKYEFFKFADTVLYDPEIYRIPNQFDRYYKARFLIQ